MDGSATPVQESAMRGLDALPSLPWQAIDIRLACDGTTDGDFDVSETDG